MIGKLKKVSYRTLRSKKICRVRIDIPLEKVRNEKVDDDELVEWLTNKVDREVGIVFRTLEDEEQEVL